MLKYPDLETFNGFNLLQKIKMGDVWFGPITCKDMDKNNLGKLTNETILASKRNKPDAYT